MYKGAFFFFIMSLLILRPKKLGKKINVFMQSLVDELKGLKEFGKLFIVHIIHPCNCKLYLVEASYVFNLIIICWEDVSNSISFVQLLMHPNHVQCKRYEQNTQINVDTPKR